MERNKIDEWYDHRIMHLLVEIAELAKQMEARCANIILAVDNWKQAREVEDDRGDESKGS